MQSIYYTAPLLLFAVLLDYIILHTDAKELLQKPDIGVQANDGMFIIAFSTKLPHGTNITCNLYTGDAPEPYRRTWTKSGACVFYVNLTDLQSTLQSVWSRDVSCDYSVSAEPGSLSPRSDRYTVPGISLVTSTSSKPVTKSTPPPTQKTKKAKKKPTPLPQTTEIATAKSSTLTAVTTSSPDQYSTAKTSTLAAVTTSAPDRHIMKPTPPPSNTKKVTEPTSPPPQKTEKVHMKNSSWVSGRVTKPVPRPTRKTKKAKKKPTPLPQTTEIATAKSSTLTAVTTSSPDQYFTKPTPPPSNTKKAENLLVIIGPAVGVALLGVTAVCLCRRHRKQKSKRPKAEPMYSSVNMTSFLSAGGAPLYSEIKDVPSTFKPPPSGSNNSSYMEGDMVYSEIKDVPCTSKSPTSGLTPNSDTVDRDMVYSEINDAPCAFKSPSSGLTPSSHTVDRDMVYSEINDVPCGFKSPSSGLKPSSDTTASGPATLTTAPLHSAVYSSLQIH